MYYIYGINLKGRRKLFYKTEKLDTARRFLDEARLLYPSAFITLGAYVESHIPKETLAKIA